jgi:hypothetical protein
MTPQSATGALEILVTAASLTTSYEEGLAAVTSGVIWLAVAGLLLSAVRKTPPKQRKRSLFTAFWVPDYSGCFCWARHLLVETRQHVVRQIGDGSEYPCRLSQHFFQAKS